MRLRSVLAVLLIVTLLSGVIGNVLLFRAQEEDLADPHRALVRSPSDRLHSLVVTHGRNVGSRFTLYTWLGERMPGTTVVLAPGHPLVTEALIGLGRAQVRYGDHDPELDPDVARSLLAEALITDWFRRYRFARESSLLEQGVPAAFDSGDFAVVVSDEHATVLRVYWHDNVVYLVDDDALRDVRDRGAVG